jgi:ribonuclease R
MTIEQICDKIISLLNKSGGSLRRVDIAKTLNFKSDSQDYDNLIEALNLLVNQEILVRNTRRRYSLKPLNSTNYEENEIENNWIESNGIIGTLLLSDKSNSGIVKTNNREFPEIIIPKDLLFTALNGDEVKVKLILQSKKKKIRGEIVEIVNRNAENISGTIEYDGHFYFLIPYEKNIKVDFLIPANELSGAKNGDKVIAEFLRWENPTKNPQVRVKEIIGKAGNPIVEYETIIKEFKLPTKFPAEVLNEANSVKVPTNRKVKNRLDLRNEDIITIDPATAKDFDDALSLKTLENGNLLLGVHIADVSHYVTENSALDKEAFLRGNSIYLVDRVIPMLPEELSNVVCSLNPDEPRFSFSVIMEINSDLNVVNYEISTSLMKSKRRFTYEEVQEIIDTKAGDFAKLIINLNDLTNKLRAKRIENGSIDYDTREIKYLLNEEKIPVDVEIRKTTEATALVEECMLLANKTVALHIKKLSAEYKVPTPLPFLYRIHDEPKQIALLEALDFIRSLGFKINKKKVSQQDINELLRKVKDKPESAVINQVLIRSMPKAVYSAVNIGHYGLGFSDYSHFTSPIRRYPDLIIHRILKEYANGKPDNKRLKILNENLIKVGAHTSETERSAMEAERASTKLASAIFANKMVGEVFDATITGVVKYGVFVLLDKIYCEGLLHTRDMRDDYYIFDTKKLKITGRRSKKSYSLGSRIRVQIIKVNIEKRQIDLALAEE